LSSSSRVSAAESLPLTTSEAFETLHPEWAALHARVPAATIFNHPAWVALWSRHFGLDTSPVYLSVRHDDELVGVVPLDMAPEGARLLGDHNLSDYGPVLAAPGAEAVVARGLIEWLVEDMSGAATLWGFDESSPLVAAFESVAGGFGWTCSIEDEAIAPACDLPEDFDAYLAELSKKDRHELRRKVRNAAAVGKLGLEEVAAPEEIVVRFDRFLAMMRDSRPDKAEFLNGPTEAFFRDAVTTTAELGFSRLATLTIDETPVAMTWSFETGDETFLYNSGYDPARTDVSPGIVSKAMVLQSAIERGKRRFNFLRGDEDYKRRMGGQPRRVLRVLLRHR
jgi:CelD/BcsL family acetyltransferase involved in cellulose biosynthesis